MTTPNRIRDFGSDTNYQIKLTTRPKVIVISYNATLSA